MVYVDDEHEHRDKAPFSLSALKQYYIPSAVDTGERKHRQADTPLVVDEETGCTSIRDDSTYCGRIRNARTCTNNTNCHWDNEFQTCSHNHRLLYYALWTGALVPVVYLLCHVYANQSQVAKTWNGLSNMHTVYLCSVALATCSFVYILSDIMYLRTYNDTRHSFGEPLLVFFVGALSVPVARALWVLRDYSQNFVTVGLLVTSGGLVWIMKKYMEGLNVEHNHLGAGALYYLLFHVLLFDNFLWWWMVFSTSTK